MMRAAGVDSVHLYTYHLISIINCEYRNQTERQELKTTIREISKYSNTTDEGQSFAVFLSVALPDEPTAQDYVTTVNALISEFKAKSHPQSYLNDLSDQALDELAMRAYGWATLVGLDVTLLVTSIISETFE